MRAIHILTQIKSLIADGTIWVDPDTSTSRPGNFIDPHDPFEVLQGNHAVMDLELANGERFTIEVRQIRRAFR